jgi:hypothetical protein
MGEEKRPNIAWSYKPASRRVKVKAKARHWEENIDVGFEVLTEVVMTCSISWDITPCSPLKVNRRFGGTYLLHLQSFDCCLLHAGFCLAYSSTLKMEATCSSEKSVDFQRATRCYIPEDRPLQLTVEWIKAISCQIHEDNKKIARIFI